MFTTREARAIYLQQLHAHDVPLLRKFLAESGPKGLHTFTRVTTPEPVDPQLTLPCFEES